MSIINTYCGLFPACGFMFMYEYNHMHVIIVRFIILVQVAAIIGLHASALKKYIWYLVAARISHLKRSLLAPVSLRLPI